MTVSMTAVRTLSDLVDEVDGRVACLALSKDPNAKVTVLFFRPGEDKPGYVAKVPTTSVAAQKVELEASTLASLDRKSLGALSESIPRVMAVVEHMGWPVLVTTALPGRVMLASYHRWRHTSRPAKVKADFDAAGRWLAEWQRHVATGRTELSMMIDGVAPEILRRFGDDALTAAVSECLGDLQTHLCDHRGEQGVLHGDFWPGNVLMEKGQVRGVIDWENSRPDGVLIRDLARFVIAYSLYLDRHTRPGRLVSGHAGLRAGAWGAGLEYAMNGTGWYPELVHEFMSAGLQRLGVDRSCIGDVIMAELACIAIEADDPEFALDHLRLIGRLRSDGPS
jgi:aminoglycoside phosphotransferase